MGIRLLAPSASFVQFTDMTINHCNFGPVNKLLPVLEDDDVSFQFVIEADTEGEASQLLAVGNTLVRVAIVEHTLYNPLLLLFDDIPDRFKISGKQVLYNWPYGLPDFKTVVSEGECFRIRVEVTLGGLHQFLSNVFLRVEEGCFTSVIEYGSEDNGFGFNYCAAGTTELIEGEEEIMQNTCEPTRIVFSNKEFLTIPYTSGLQAMYGPIPTVQVWIYDESGELVNAGLPVNFDTYPPSIINFDFGGTATGVIIIK